MQREFHDVVIAQGARQVAESCIQCDATFVKQTVTEKQRQPLCVNTFECGFLSGASGKEPTSQCRRRKRHRFNP